MGLCHEALRMYISVNAEVSQAGRQEPLMSLSLGWRESLLVAKQPLSRETLPKVLVLAVDFRFMVVLHRAKSPSHNHYFLFILTNPLTPKCLLSELVSFYCLTKSWLYIVKISIKSYMKGFERGLKSNGHGSLLLWKNPLLLIIYRLVTMCHELGEWHSPSISWAHN